MPGSSDALRILVVSPREDAPGEVSEALSGRLADAQVSWVSQDSLALGRAEDLHPQAVLVYADVGAEACVALIRRLAQRLPEAATFAVVPWDGMSLARHAVLAGARGFVMQPIDPEELNRTLAGVLGGGAAPARSPASSDGAAGPGHLVVFCAPKGGTGRTTLAVNAALSLRGVTGESVIIIDADYAAPAIDVALNLKHMHDLGDLLPRLAEMDEALVESVLIEHSSGVRALLAPPSSRGEEPVSAPQIQQLLRVVRRMSQWVLVDLGLPLDDTAFAFLEAADRVVLNVLPETIGLRNTHRVLERMEEHGIPREQILVVVNRSTLPGGMPLGDIQTRFGIEVAFQVPDDQPTATSSVNRGVPLVIDRRYTALARAMRRFARGLAAEISQPDQGPAFPRPVARRAKRKLSRWVWVGAALVVLAVAGALGAPMLVEALRAQRQAAGVAAASTPAQVALGDPTAEPTPEPTAAPTAMTEPTAAPMATRGTPATATESVAAAVQTSTLAAPLEKTASAGATATEPPSPTATATPTQTATVTHTASPTATATATATATRTATATASPTARPAATPTLQPIYASGWYPSPLLVGPENRETFASDERPILQWEPSGDLRPGVFYVITLAYSYRGLTVYDDVPWVTETSWDASEHRYLRDVAEQGQFYWSLTLMRRTGVNAEGKPIGAAISAMSEVRGFTWSPAPPQ